MAINVSHMVQEIAMELLSNAGFSVSLADDGDVAVETLRTARRTAPLPKCLADSPFLSAGTVNFLLLEKEEKKFTVPADFFLHSFGEVC